MQTEFWEYTGLENNIIRQWSVPPEVVSLETDQVHVWRVHLNLSKQALPRNVQVLSLDEVKKAEKFYLEADRIRYSTTRVVVREILSSYLGVRPEEIIFAYNQYGKPYLVSAGPERNLNFNISHAGDMSLLAVTLDRRIGVDIELVRDEASIETIAKRFFLPSEVSQLLSLPESLRQEAFFTCWTRKEAFIKAQGQGLSIPLDQFEVTFIPNEIPRLIIADSFLRESQVWSIIHLEPGPDYVGALVVEGDGLKVTGWDWVS